MIRAAAATLAVFAAPSRAAIAFARLMAAYAENVAEQAQRFPRCMAAEYAREDAGQPAYERALAGYLADARASLAAAQAFRSPASEVEALQVEVAELEKETRKGVWYYSPGFCECAACAPITPPMGTHLPTADGDLPTRWEICGEQGADF